MKTDMERKNDERLKAIIRDWLQDKIDGAVHSLEAFYISREYVPNPYVDACIADWESKLATLRWLHAMTRPSDPNTINQYTSGSTDAAT